MKKFAYKKIIDEFRSYLDDNLSETVYFEALRHKNYDDRDNQLVYSEIIRKNLFSLNYVLDNTETSEFTGRLRALRKVREYEAHAFKTFENLDTNSEFQDRVNSIQAISTFYHLDSKHLLSELYKEIDNFPLSVKISFLNFDLLVSKDPYDTLSNLLNEVDNNKKTEALYFNFIRYYFSHNDIMSLLRQRIDANHIAFFIAILYIYSRTGNDAALKVEARLVERLFRKMTDSLPSEIEAAYHISAIIRSYLPAAK